MDQTLLTVLGVAASILEAFLAVALEGVYVAAEAVAIVRLARRVVGDGLVEALGGAAREVVVDVGGLDGGDGRHGGEKIGAKRSHVLASWWWWW